LLEEVGDEWSDQLWRLDPDPRTGRDRYSRAAGALGAGDRSKSYDAEESREVFQAQRDLLRAVGTFSSRSLRSIIVCSPNAVPGGPLMTVAGGRE
jgi:hypothetical protein